MLSACDPSTENAFDASAAGARSNEFEDAVVSADPPEAGDEGGDAASEQLDAGLPPPQVRWYGNLKSVFAGNWDAATSLSEAVPERSAYALGALSDLRGEFLVIRGNAMLVYPTESKLPRVVAAHHGHGIDETATLLVAADVSTWREFPIATDVPSNNIEAWLRATAQAQGVDVSKPFPFLLQGRFRNVGWHVADGTRVLPGMRPDTNAQHGTIAEGDGTIVGFYSTEHQGIFTMMGENTHMHIVLGDHSVLGHVRALDVVSGGVLSLP
ncbi:MAG TPA: acetolactate decarboxylase [Polyangiales bacterium]|nr:acetolactate decarboxylase [Polyangiales bacterium]